MTYPSDFEAKLGFGWIRQRIAGYCHCTLGIKLVDNIQFSTSPVEIESSLKSTIEYQTIKGSGENFPLKDCFDPSDHYPVIKIEGSFLEVDVLRDIAASLVSVNACRKFILKRKAAYPTLDTLGTEVNIPEGLPESLASNFDEKGNIRDNASPDLSKIRKRLRESEGKARKLVDHIFRELSAQSLTVESMQPVLREGRIAIPVKSENKRRVRGIILDESATGQTVFIEPAEVVEASNEIRDLQLEERREIVKILTALTRLLRDNFQHVVSAFDFMGQLDMIQAKAKFSLEIDGCLPTFSDRPLLDWRNARHPVLILSHKNAGDIVPLNINLRESDKFLLVSGPNAGGKSVCLKTVGLLQYMLQCGLPVPMDETSKVGMFDQIFVDIGDQQSIENDLSTYSSHLRNMNYFLTHSNPSTLVLMDELGAGTDPNFGGGIAEAVLEQLVANGVWGVVTTHYYNLKLFASNTNGIRNAAMLFDTRNLRPLFQLEIDKPGSSFALEIARKTGLSESIIDRAKKIIGEELSGLETLMKSVEEEKLKVAHRERLVREQEKKYQDLLTKYQQLLDELESRKKEIINSAKSEAASLLKETNREIEKTIRHIKENKAERKETRKAREGLRQLGDKVAIGERSSVKGTDEIRVGDRVRMIGQEVTGEVLSVKGDSALVQFGQFKSTTKVNRLTKSTNETERISTPYPARAFNLYAKQSEFNTTLDVRGKRADEAVQMIARFLDDATLLGHGELKILHGKGTGVLRKVIREQLKASGMVTSFHDEHVERGGDGITVVVLK